MILSNLGKFIVTCNMIKIKGKSLLEMQSIEPKQIMQNKMAEINLNISIIKVNIKDMGYNIEFFKI